MKKLWEKYTRGEGYTLHRNLDGSTWLRVHVGVDGYAALVLSQGIYNASVTLGWDMPRNSSDKALKVAAMVVAKAYVRLLRGAGL